MTFAAGARLGPYEILSPLGAGGMGEVWRARDTRLAREVALKVLPAEVSEDRGRLRRFEREALSASALSHPNIVTIYEVGSAESRFYIAMERVDGTTLRELLVGAPLPIKKLLQTAAQIAAGLARAHEAGIVHRDLKPENVMVTKDGLVKILDFGLAKLTHPGRESGHAADLPTQTETSPGVAVGTTAYMSPEQASGEPVDFRSDQFAFGSMLYEMATGRSAFLKRTGVDTLAAILHDEPESIAAIHPRVPGPVRWIVERCLAKEPRDRYASTADLAQELSGLREHVTELSSGGAIPIGEKRKRSKIGTIAAALAALAALAGVYLAGQRVGAAHETSPRFRQLTFRGVGIGTARFAPDGQTIVFSSQTEGKPPELYSMRLDSPEVRSLGLPPAHVLSISSSGEMAILLLRPYLLFPRIGHLALEQIPFFDVASYEGTLARASLSGGEPRELLDNVTFADWAADGAGLAAVHRTGAGNRVEFPLGTVVAREEYGLLNYLRNSRRGRLALKDWGGIFLNDAGNTSHLIPGDRVAYEIAWSERTGEIWYTQPTPPVQTVVRAVTREGRDRVVASLPGDFVLYDISADGRVLLGRMVIATEILGSFPNEPHERNLSHFDGSFAVDLSGSGDELLFNDVFRPEFTGAGATYVRKTDGSPPKRLGEVGSSALSPDGTVVLAEDSDGAGSLLLFLPTGAGETQKIRLGRAAFDVIEQLSTGFFPDGRRVYFAGDSSGGHRVWVAERESGKVRPVTPPGTHRPVLVGDGQYVCARDENLRWRLYPTAEGGGNAPMDVVGILPGEAPIRSTPAGLLYVRGAEELRPGEAVTTTRVYRLDPRTGRRELWKEIPPRDPRTGGAVTTILFSADGKTCVWTHLKYSTELVLVEGLK
jgi:hypothetical protein